MTKRKPKKRKKKKILSREKEKERGKGVLRPFFRAVFPDHRAQPPLLLHPFFYIKEEKKPLSSRRVKRLFSNLLADIGFITSLSFVSTPLHFTPTWFLALFTHLHCRRPLIATWKNRLSSAV